HLTKIKTAIYLEPAPKARQIVAPGVSPGNKTKIYSEPSKRATEVHHLNKKYLSPLPGLMSLRVPIPGLTPGATIQHPSTAAVLGTPLCRPLSRAHCRTYLHFLYSSVTAPAIRTFAE